jgi:hypothetical protein
METKGKIQMTINMIEDRIVDCQETIGHCRKTLLGTLTNGSDIDITIFAPSYIEKISKESAKINEYNKQISLLYWLMNEEE